MTLFTSVAGWATFGLAARGFANALERKHPLSGAAGHAGAAAIFGAFGYWVHGVQQTQRAELEKALALVRERKRRQLEAAASSE
ncbi:hypothetical protein BCR44DRAFT_55825 [Catenaria anguillulae PL171]|uniref:Uncharacterized protein n=1 Tax=Catenaria anguillulae PL171 TaxID=765915 RepID=A0A1Y2I3C7_9FUNG|nr:hypothetical protein BCR44DRAFT_55825 [Catenaria anguillulae PL171]